MFRGVKGSKTVFVVRRTLEAAVLCPAILPLALFLVIGRRHVAIVGRASPVISMLVAPLEAHLRTLTAHQRRTWIVLNLSRADNQFVEDVYRREIRLFGSQQRFRRRVCWWAALCSRRMVELKEQKSHTAWSCGTQVVRLAPAEVRQGEEQLRRLGLDLESPYFCFTSRHQAYYDRLRRAGVVVKSRSIRDPDEATYLEASVRIAARLGIPAVRIGRDLDPLARRSTEGGIIDYAGRGRNDLCDVVLAAHTTFLLNGATGAFWLTEMFHRPQVNGDVYDARHVQLDGSVFTIQRVRSAHDGRLLTLREMLAHESRYADERYQSSLGLELVRNDVDDLVEASLELQQRLSGAWEPSAEDTALQRQYREIVARHSSEPTWMGRGVVSTAFLRKHPDLLA